MISEWKKQCRCWFTLRKLNFELNLRNTEKKSLVLKIRNMGFQKLRSGVWERSLETLEYVQAPLSDRNFSVKPFWDIAPASRR